MENKDEVKDNEHFAQKTFENMKKFTKDKAIPSIKKTAENTKNTVTNVSSKAIEKIKTTVTEEQMAEILNTLYIKSVNGIPKVSLPVDDLVADYIKKCRADLIETLAFDIVELIKASSPDKIDTVKVNIRKLQVPINGLLDSAEVELEA